jgi:hypothetical protein
MRGMRVLSSLLVLLVLLPAAPGALAEETKPQRLRLEVNRDGYFQLPPTPDGVGSWRVTRQGRGVPVARMADGQEALLATGVATPWSSRARYDLAYLGDDHVPPPPPPAGPLPGSLDAMPATRNLDHDLRFGPVAGARVAVYAGDLPNWYLSTLPPQGTVTIDLAPAGAAPGHAQTLEVAFAGTHVGEATLRAVWGGHDLGVRTGPAAAGSNGLTTLRWHVPADQVPAKAATLSLRDESPTMPRAHDRDVTDDRGRIWVDRISLRGTTNLIADESLRVYDLHLQDGTTPIHGAHVPSPTQPLALILDPTGRVLPCGVLALPEPANTWQLSFPRDAPVGSKLYLQGKPFTAVAKTAPPLPDPLPGTLAATHLILATPALLEHARRLAEHRTATGTPSAVVDVTQVYERDGFGLATPSAIRLFLERRRKAEGATPLRYVLLVGDAVLDRGDMARFPTIPTPMARTMFNGATSSDRLYVNGAGTNDQAFGGPSIGRLPFRDAKTLGSYVDRLIAYETRPPVHDTRRLMRFVTSEGRFGPVIDRLTENLFRNIVAEAIPPAFDIEITFASASSPFLWPPRQFNEKVVGALNEGALFYTYVGHGWAHGFDSLRVGSDRYPILSLPDVPKVNVSGTPPIMLVVACTTAMFDAPRGVGIGEALLASPNGPVAYWGATRICHPAANSVIGRALALYMVQEGEDRRLGDVIRKAWDSVLDPAAVRGDPQQGLIRMVVKGFIGEADMNRLVLEGRWMYTLLGDPALRIAFPAEDIGLDATFVDEGRAMEITVAAALPDGTPVTLRLESKRNRNLNRTEPVSNVADPRMADTIRENHRRMNDWTLAEATVTLEGGKATMRLAQPVSNRTRILKAIARTTDQVHQGAVVIPPTK